jgi:hypothetical protein
MMPQYRFSRTLNGMEVHFAPDLQAKIDQLVVETGYAPDRLVEDAMAGYLAESPTGNWYRPLSNSSRSMAKKRRNPTPHFTQ